MPAARPLSHSLRLILLFVAALWLAACGSIDGATRGMAEALTIYRPEVTQGNFVSAEQVQALRPGMSRLQVRDILGTPLMASVFHADRWDYVFTLKRQKVEPQHYHLAVFFVGDALQRIEGDEMPSETEFVERISPRRKVKVPELEASEQQLQSFSAAAEVAPAEPPEMDPPPAGHYPPLE